nr:hypothetical protein [Tanacetum cinerariifolium]
FQDSHDDEEDSKSSKEYMNDIEEEYQERALLAKSKRLFKKVHPQAKKGLIVESYDWDEEEVSPDDNDVTEVKALMALANEKRVSVGKESARNDNSEVSIIGSNKPKLSKAEDFTLSNYDTGDESSVYSTHHPPLEKLTGVEPVFGPKTIKLILKLKSTFKAKALKGITINESSSAPARGNKSFSVSKTNSHPASKLKNVKMEDDHPLAIVMKELNELKLQISNNKSSYFENKNSQQIPPNALQNKFKT